MLVYDAFNIDVFEEIPINLNSLLDVGCGSGQMGVALMQRDPNLKITGITYSLEEKGEADNYYEDVIVCDLNNQLPSFDKKFDCIVFSHILEHTYDPIQILTYFKKYLSNDGKIVIALPNILYYKQRLEFLKGNFVYSKNGGLMDITHFRFFDWQTTHQLVYDASLRICKIKATGNFPLSFFRKLFPNLASRIDAIFLRSYPGLFGFQFIIVAN